jgi:methionine-rich copper-binding protein CopC
MKKTHRLFTISAAFLLSTGLILMVAVGTALAHAKVISATPGIGSTIATAPTTVAVKTAENMNPDPKKSNLFVYGPNGDLISQGNAKIPLSTPNEMSVPIKADGNGIYVVRWITVSAGDGDPDEGAFTFTVNPNGANATTGVTAKPTTTTGTSAATAPQSSSPVIPAAITGIVALLIGLGAGFGFGRNRTRTALATTDHTEPTQPENKVTSK